MTRKLLKHLIINITILFSSIGSGFSQYGSVYQLNSLPYLPVSPCGSFKIFYSKEYGIGTYEQKYENGLIQYNKAEFNYNEKYGAYTSKIDSVFFTPIKYLAKLILHLNIKIKAL